MTGASLSEPPVLPRSSGTRLLPTATDRMGGVAADIVAAFVRENPHGVLGVATGASPEPVYLALARARQLGLRTEGLGLAALDEYVGLDPLDRRSYSYYVRERIAEPLGIAPARVLVPRIGELGPDAAALAHERRITELGGVGLQLAGIGSNGHLGFNEPGAPFDSRTRVVELAESTRRDNALYFGGEITAVPTHAVTQGIATVLEAGAVLLIARGTSKRPALAAAIAEPMDRSIPVSALQLHPRVTIVADHAALGMLTT